MQRIALSLAAALVAMGIGVVAGGAFLPRTHRAAAEVVIDRPTDQVWTVVRDLQAMPEWWPDARESKRLADADGRERWRQVTGGVEFTLEIVHEQPPQHLETRIVAPDGAAFGGAWKYELHAAGSGTRVKVTEDAWVGPWPFRTIAWMSGYHTSIDSYLAHLGRRFGQQVTPAHVEPSTEEDALIPPAAASRPIPKPGPIP